MLEACSLIVSQGSLQLHKFTFQFFWDFPSHELEKNCHSFILCLLVKAVRNGEVFLESLITFLPVLRENNDFIVGSFSNLALLLIGASFRSIKCKMNSQNWHTEWNISYYVSCLFDIHMVISNLLFYCWYNIFVSFPQTG